MNDGTLIVDIKTGVYANWHILQLSAYGQLLSENRKKFVDGLLFDEQGHRYSIAGRSVPSVSEVIEIVRPKSFTFDPADAERGTAVHSLCEQYDIAYPFDIQKNKYDGYLDAWISWREASGYNYDTYSCIDGIEVKLGSTAHWYAGTIDRIFGDSGKISGACVYISEDGSYFEKKYSAKELIDVFNNDFKILLEATKVARKYK